MISIPSAARNQPGRSERENRGAPVDSSLRSEFWMIELAPHQREAIDRIAELFERFRGAILAGEAGLGKSFVAAEVAAKHRGAVEMLIPASLVGRLERTARQLGAAE